MSSVFSSKMIQKNYKGVVIFGNGLNGSANDGELTKLFNF